jgi:hypothetical protein
MQEFEPDYFNENEDDLLEDCEYAYEEFDEEKAAKNLKAYKFRYVTDKDGVGE